MDILPNPTPGRMQLIVAPTHIAGEMARRLLAHLALDGPVDVIDGSNRFEIYAVARLIRRQSRDLPTVLQRIRLARAFTCYQMTALITHIRADAVPKLVLDLTATFYDEGVTPAEACRLLQGCLQHLQDISRTTPTTVFARPQPLDAGERACLIRRLHESADVWVYTAEKPQPQPRLL